MTSICDFGSLPNRTSLRECLLDSISTARVSSRGMGVGGKREAREGAHTLAKPGLRFLLKINPAVHSPGPETSTLLRGATYSTQQRSAGASPRLNDTCTSPPAASADAAAAHRQRAGGN